jgi:CRP-like cAMP-binding protein
MNTKELGQFSILEGMSSGELEKICALCEEVTFPDGEALFREGDASLYLYLIRSGRVSLRMALPNQKVLVIGTLEPGEELGWSAVRENKPYTASAVAVGTVEALRLPGGELLRLFEEEPRMGYRACSKLLGVVAERLEEARTRIANMTHS